MNNPENITVGEVLTMAIIASCCFVVCFVLLALAGIYL